MLAFSNTPITHAGQMDSAQCQNNEKDCLCETDKEIEACRAKIPAAEEKARIKSLFGYPSNRHIARVPAKKPDTRKERLPHSN